MSDHLNVLLVGTGDMGIAYAGVLRTLGAHFLAVGRSERSAVAFERSTGVTAARGGLETWLRTNRTTIDLAIVSVSADQLAVSTSLLIDYGVRRILVEKPGGVTGAEIRSVGDLAGKHASDVRLAYNRRFYASVRRAREMIAEDGGPTSLNFEFTEWAYRIESLEHPPGVLPNWLLANSSHVIDTAFFLAGQPQSLSPYAAGGLSWHDRSVYAGAGVTTSGALFSYHANWQAPGRWGIEVMTRKHRLILRPLEKLAQLYIGSIEPQPVEFDDSLDSRFKPGLYRQTEAFLFGNNADLLTIGQQIEHLSWYERINDRAA